MKTIIASALIAICLNSLWGQNIPHAIEEIPIPPAFIKNTEGYGGFMSYRWPLKTSFYNPNKVGEYLSDFSLKVLTVNMYTSNETYEDQLARCTNFYTQKLNPNTIPYEGNVGIDKIYEPDISVLKPGESSRIDKYVTGKIEWYYRESRDTIRKFWILHKNDPAYLLVYEEIYTKDTQATPLPENLHFSILPQSTFLPDESNFYYQYTKIENATKVVGHVSFQSQLGYEETVKYFEDKLNSKAEKSYSGNGAYFKKNLNNSYEKTLLTINNEPPSFQATKVSDGRVLVVYDYFYPKCNFKVIVNDVAIFK